MRATILYFLPALTLCGAAQAQKCENPDWNYCGGAIDKCCPPQRSYACINLLAPMRMPRGWSGCVRPGSMFSAAAWENSCETLYGATTKSRRLIRNLS